MTGSTPESGPPGEGGERDPEAMAGEAFPLLEQAVGSILKGSDDARAAYDALLARVLLATMFHVGAQSQMLEKAGGGTGLRKRAFARLAKGETAGQIFEGPAEED